MFGNFSILFRFQIKFQTKIKYTTSIRNVDWHEVGMSGVKPDMPAKGYTHRTILALNQEIWEKYQTTTYDEALKMIKKSFLAVQKSIKYITSSRRKISSLATTYFSKQSLYYRIRCL